MQKKMRFKKIVYLFLIFLIFTSLLLGLIILSLKKSQQLEVSFLNVGQGDAILIESGNRQVLIDAGKNGRTVLEKLGEEMPFWDRTLETVIITHPDLDHYGGLGDILKYYQVESVLKTEAENTAEEWQEAKRDIEKEKSMVLNSTFGSTIVFPNGAKLEIIYPFSKVEQSPEDKNDTSIVARLDFGENRFLFTGDLSQAGEAELLKYGADISADILKVGHHGSKSSSSDKFIQKINPQQAIISVGKNSYGHPHPEVLERLESNSVKIWRTDESGTVKYKCKNPNNFCEIFVD
ncbi:MAG: ComEC/Rec2 family competence protein [Candidatus Moraniibacteriota bacterium]